MVKEGENNGSANPTYLKWIIEAIGKIRHQKQRPNVERICHAVKQCHKVSDESIEEQLNLAVKDGSVLKVYNKGKGVWSFKDPAIVSQGKSRTLKLGKKCDLTKFIIRTIRELNNEGGSTLRSIGNHISNSYNIEAQDGMDLMPELKTSLKNGISNGYFIKDGRFIKLGDKCSSESDSVGSGSNSGSFDEDSASDLSFSFDEKTVC